MLIGNGQQNNMLLSKQGYIRTAHVPTNKSQLTITLSLHCVTGTAEGAVRGGETLSSPSAVYFACNSVYTNCRCHSCGLQCRGTVFHVEQMQLAAAFCKGILHQSSARVSCTKSSDNMCLSWLAYDQKTHSCNSCIGKSA